MRLNAATMMNMFQRVTFLIATERTMADMLSSGQPDGLGQVTSLARDDVQVGPQQRDYFATVS